MGDTNEQRAGSIVIDVKDAEAAYDALKPTLDAIPQEKVRRARIDMQKAATHAFGLTARDRAPDRASGFTALAGAGVIAAEPLDRYAQAALATWYARQQQLRFAAIARGTVPAAIAEDAEAIKKRMLKVGEYYFGDHGRYGLELRAISAGNGYQDTANDLQQLADFYESPEVAPTIARDPQHYRDTDVRDARALAGEIFRALGLENTQSAEWTKRVRRAYTHLCDTYAEHCYAGSLLFFRAEDVSLTYPPSLVSVVRLPPSRTSEQEVVVGGPTPGPDAGGGPVTPPM